jgi:hypothetical protein
MLKVKFFNTSFPQGGGIKNEKLINADLDQWKEQDNIEVVAISPFNFRNSNLISLCVMYREK